MEKQVPAEQIGNSDESSFFGRSKDQSGSRQNNLQDQQNKSTKAHKKKLIRKENKTSNKPKLRKQKSSKDIALKQAAVDIAKNIIEQMDKRFEEDIKLLGHKPATKKISYISTLSRQLRNVYVCQQFLQLNGLSMFQKWLRKLSDGHQPNLNLRKHLLEILDFLKVRQDHISKAQQLQRIIQRNKKSQTKEIRDLCQSIINKWSKITYYDINE